MTKFKVNAINFDFSDSQGDLPKEEQKAIVKDALNTEWSASDENDLIETITDHYGWCILSIDIK